jgi:hypothetical protein
MGFVFFILIALLMLGAERLVTGRREYVARHRPPLG